MGQHAPSEHPTGGASEPILSRFVLAPQLRFVYAQFMHTRFGAAPLPLGAWIKSILVAMTILPVMSVERWWRVRKARRAEESERRAFRTRWRA
ncbi:hypothetical protein [Sorangium sp. So ce145]|uniref:hypothetical protein n=1 Tax=Sorangium sp. So ce145 TaxID=3133285 RepID=UPI003F6124E0